MAAADHANVTFRCKMCTETTKMFPDFTEIRRHYSMDHGIREIQSKIGEYVTVPSNLICLKCKFCRHHLHAQTMDDFEEHFKLEHPGVKSPKKHLDYLCRICMHHDLNETLEDLEQHIEEEHSDILKAVSQSQIDPAVKESNDDAAANRAADKAKSPDVSRSAEIALAD